MKSKEASIINAFTAMIGKRKTKKNYSDLLAKTKSAIANGEKSKHLNYIKESLENLIRDNETIFKLGDVGEKLFSVAVLEGRPKKKKRVKTRKSLSGFAAFSISGNEQTIPINDYWKELFGNPYPGFYAFVHGAPGSGKSSLLLQFAQYFAQNFGKTAYISYEEGRKFTMQEKLKRLKIDDTNLFIFENYEEIKKAGFDLSDFKLIIIDSLQTGGISAADLRETRKSYPKTSFVVIGQQTKEGKFKGSNEFAHDADVIIDVKNGTANSYAKNRLGKGGEISISFFK